jgi:hypothetical protein
MFHIFRKQVNNGMFQAVYCPVEDQVVDILTKPKNAYMFVVL